VGNDTITIENILSASAEEVWNAWTQPQLVLKWFGSDPEGWGIHAQMDVKPGGSYEISFANGDGTQYTLAGVYQQVEPYRHLIFTWEWKNEPGVQSLVSVNLSPAQHGTLMHFTHAHVGYASRHDYLYGWQSTFEKLKRLIEK